MTGFVWCDLSAYRPKTAAAFYTRVLGWHCEPDDYAIATTGKTAVAALYDMPKTFRDIGMPSFWMSYIAVKSVPETVALARRAGGRIELTDTFGDGQIALIRDPLGAGFTIYQGSMPPGGAGLAPGYRAAHVLLVSDTKITEFYEAVFGWTVSPSAAGAHLSADDLPIAEVRETPAEHRGGYEYWAIVFSAPDLGQAAKAVQAHGGTVFGTTPFAVGTALAAADMDGAAFHLVEART